MRHAGAFEIQILTAVSNTVSFPEPHKSEARESPKSPWDCNALAEITGKMTPPNQKFTMSSTQMTTGRSS